MKTEEELEQIKEEYVKLSKKLSELTEDELKQVTGGTNGQYEFNSYENTVTEDFRPR